MKDHDTGEPPSFIHVSTDIFPDTLKRHIPGYAEQDALGLDAVIPVKLFSPITGWTWYPIGFDGDANFVGLVQGWAEEPGSFTYADFLVYGEGLVLRDLDFQPTTLRQLRSPIPSANSAEGYQYDPYRYDGILMLQVGEE